jgi:hypothetical protein
MGGILQFILSAPVRLLFWTLFGESSWLSIIALISLFFVLAAADIGLAIYNRYNSDNVATIGYAAHLGGVLAGH